MTLMEDLNINPKNNIHDIIPDMDNHVSQNILEGGEARALEVKRKRQESIALNGNKKGVPDIAQHRARLGKEFMARMRADFQKHGIATIERVRKEKPAAYLELVARMVPMAMEVNVNHTFMDLLKEAQERYASQSYPKGNVFDAEVVRED